MVKLVFVLWQSRDADHYFDVLREDDIRSRNKARLEHAVYGPSGHLYGKAVCRVRVNESYSDLDYAGEFAEINDKARMAIGVMRCRFHEYGMIQVFWKADGSRAFEPAEAVALRQTDLKLLSAGLSQPTSGSSP